MDDQPTAPPRRRRVSRGLIWATAIVTLIGWGPIWSVMLATWFANLNDCPLNGNYAPCIVGGHDYGWTLHTMFDMGWVVFLTFPLMFVAIILGLVLTVQVIRALIKR